MNNTMNRKRSRVASIRLQHRRYSEPHAYDTVLWHYMSFFTPLYVVAASFKRTLRRCPLATIWPHRKKECNDTSTHYKMNETKKKPFSNTNNNNENEKGCILAFSAGGFIAVGHSLLSDVPSSKIIKKSIGGACAGLGVYVIVPTWCRQMWLQKF